MTGRLLIIDEDEISRALVASVLTPLNFTIDQAKSPTEALLRINAHDPSIVIIDLGHTMNNGTAFLTELQRISSASVIVISGRPTEHECVEVLLHGADDYLAKPFSSRELAARVGSVLRRSGRVAVDWRSRTMRFGSLQINIAARQVLVEERLIELRAKEFELLAHLVSEPMRVFSREELLKGVWSSSPEWQDPATVTEHIRRLRLRLVHEGINAAAITNVRGAGYRFEPHQCVCQALALSS
jgi:two-component system, OmpR family, phosphate regulon response regulator PhoB